MMDLQNSDEQINELKNQFLKNWFFYNDPIAKLLQND